MVLEQEVAIVPFDDLFREGILSIMEPYLREAFPPASYDKALAGCSSHLRPDECIVALLEGEVVGYGTYFQFGTETARRFSFLRRDLDERYFPLVRGDATVMERYTQQIASGTVEVFNDSEDLNGAIAQFASTGKPLETLDDDVFFVDTAVREDFRGRGIAQALITRKLDLARELGASAVYFTAMNDASVNLYRSHFGAFPLVRMGSRSRPHDVFTSMGVLL